MSTTLGACNGKRGPAVARPGCRRLVRPDQRRCRQSAHQRIAQVHKIVADAAPPLQRSTQHRVGQVARRARQQQPPEPRAPAVAQAVRPRHHGAARHAAQGALGAHHPVFAARVGPKGEDVVVPAAVHVAQLRSQRVGRGGGKAAGQHQMGQSGVRRPPPSQQPQTGRDTAVSQHLAGRAAPLVFLGQAQPALVGPAPGRSCRAQRKKQDQLRQARESCAYKNGNTHGPTRPYAGGGELACPPRVAHAQGQN